jgi:hypothetical protein
MPTKHHKSISIMKTFETCSEKQYASISLMTRVLKTCDRVIYSDAQGQPEWEQDMQIEIDSQLKNHTWDLVPRP